MGVTWYGRICAALGVGAAAGYRSTIATLLPELLKGKLTAPFRLQTAIDNGGAAGTCFYEQASRYMAMRT